jgi:TolA-binding protein
VGTEKLAGQAIDETRALGANLQKLSEAITGLKTEYTRSNGELQKELRTQLAPVSSSFKEIHETLVSMQRQYDALALEVKALKNKPQELPGAREIFGLAMDDYYAGQYALSVTGFREFLAQFGSDQRASSAQFQIAEAEFALKNYEAAETDYDLALQKYPDFDKKCTALWKKGQTQVELKRPLAKATLTEVTRACPGSPEATNAADLLKRLPR